MMGYNWPGNIRELENAIYRAVNICHKGEVLPEHLPKDILKNSRIHENIKDREDENLNPLEKSEIGHILNILEENDWNKKKAAEIIGISRSTLYRRIKKYDIEP